MNEENHTYPVIVIGGGPCGIATAAELAKKGIDSLIIEKGAVTESIRQYPKRMKFFSTAENIEIAGIPFSTGNVKPDRSEALQYYRKVAQYFKLKFQLNTTVSSVVKSGAFFEIETDRGTFKASKVVLSTGYFNIPRPLDISGENGINVSRYYDEPYAYSFQKVVIIGAGNSGIEAALELYRHNADVTLVARGADVKATAKYWLVPDLKNRVKEGKIKLVTNARPTEIGNGYILVEKELNLLKIPADFVFLLIGYLPDANLLTRCGLKPDPETLLLKHNPHTYESEVDGLYLCGTVLAGIHTEKVFIENGREHAVAIAEDIKRACDLQPA